jgi:tellurite resistance protein TerC
VPTSATLDGERFFTIQNGRRLATPLLLVLLLVEATDLIFAVDSIPAVFAVTDDPFIVFTSNVLALLGLRSLYFVLSDWVSRFHYLKHALSVVLGFVGVKMLVAGVIKIPIAVSLGAIVLTLVVALLLSVRRARRLAAQAAPTADTSAKRTSTSPMLKGFSS